VPGAEGRAVGQGAFVFINVSGDHTRSVHTTIQRFHGVKAVYTVTGAYDIIVHVETDSFQDLGELILSKIRAIDGVNQTVTCLILS
jgi:Lrp/AsnC family leucine-responsive transcriptional regulator